MTENEALKLLKVSLPVQNDKKFWVNFFVRAHKSWKRLMLQNHPDTGGSHKVAVQLNEAWERVKSIKFRPNQDYNAFSTFSKTQKSKAKEMNRNTQREIFKGMFGDSPYADIAKEASKELNEKIFEAFIKNLEGYENDENS